MLAWHRLFNTSVRSLRMSWNPSAAAVLRIGPPKSERSWKGMERDSDLMKNTLLCPPTHKHTYLDSRFLAKGMGSHHQCFGYLQRRYLSWWGTHHSHTHTTRQHLPRSTQLELYISDQHHSQHCHLITAATATVCPCLTHLIIHHLNTDTDDTHSHVS